MSTTHGGFSIGRFGAVLVCVAGFAAAGRAQDAAAGRAESLVDLLGAVVDDESVRTQALLEAALTSPAPETAELALLRFYEHAERFGAPPDTLPRAAAAAADASAPGFRRRFARDVEKRWLLRTGRFDDAARARGRDGFIRDFRVLGPLGPDYSHYGGVVFEPERRLDLAATYAGTLGPTKFRPLTGSFLDEEVDLDSVLPDGRGAAYAVAVLVVDEEQELDLALSTGGSAELFCDGRRALTLDRQTAFLPSYRMVRARFAPGAHRLMVKALDQGGRSFALRVRTTDGAAVDLASGGFGTVRVLSADAEVPALGPPATGTGANGAFVVQDLREALRAPRSRAGALVRGALLAEHGLADAALASVAEYEKAADLKAGEILLLTTLVRFASDVPEAERKARDLDLARRLAAAVPGHPEAVARLAQEEIENDRGEQALATLEAALAVRPQDFLLRETFIEACDRLGFRADAERATSALAAAYPDSTAATSRLYARLRARGDGDLADRALARLLELDAADESVRSDFVRRAAARGRSAEARAAQEVLRRLRPHDERVALTAADLAREAGDFETERRILQEAATAPPDHRTEAWRRLGDGALAAGDRDAAIAAYREVLRRDPDAPSAVRKALDALAPPPHDYFAEYAADVPRLLREAPDASTYPDAAIVLLLDQVILHVRADGTARHEVHQLHRLQDPRGRDELGRIGVQGEPLVVRTVTPDGRTLWPNSLQRGQYEMAGLTKGVVVERRYRYDLSRFVGEPEDFGGFYFQDTEGEAPFHLTRYVVVLPKTLGLTPTLDRYPGKPVVVERGDDVIYEFKLERMPKIKRERAMPPPDEIAPYVSFKRSGSFAALNRRVLSHFEHETRVNDALAKAAATAVGEATDPLEKARLLHAFVLKNVPTEEGGGSPAVTLAERAGPRLPLFAALLSAAGVPWRPCAARAAPRFGPPARVGFTDFSAFDAELVRVEPPGRPPVYVTTDLRFRPFGALPYVLCDAPVFVADRDGGFLDRTPAAPLDAATDMERRYELQVRADGVGVGTARLVFGPEASAQLKDRLADADRSEYEPALLRLLLDPLGRLAAKATGPVVVEGLGRADGALAVSAPVELKKLLRDASGGGDLVSPIAPLKVARRFVDRAERTHPVVFRGLEVSRDEAVVRLDATWRPSSVPDSIVLDGPLGGFVLRRTYDEATRTLVFERRVKFEPFTLPAEEFPAFATWLSNLDQEEERQVRLEKDGP